MYTYEDLFINKIFGELLDCKSNNDSLLKISINLTDYCNYMCNYCIVDAPNKINKQTIKKEFLNIFFKYMKKHLPELKFRVNLLGGEPTLYKDLNYVIDSIINNYPNICIMLLTNGSQSVYYYQKLVEDYKIHLDISYHPEFADDNHFISIIDMLKDNYNYQINILLDYDYYDKIIKFIDKLNNKYDQINLYYSVLANIDYNNTKFNIFNDLLNKQINNTIKLYTLKFEKREIILSYKDISSFNSNNRNIFKYMKCDIFNRQWIINSNSTISTRCSKKTYRLLPNDINKFLCEYENNNGILCNYDICNCDCMIEPHKHK